MSNKILISEIFGPTIQGEGVLLGHPTVFVRTGGCDSRCVWCDTGYAVLPKYKDQWTKQTVDEILDRVDLLCGELKPGLSRPVITLSGGNPALQPFQYFINPAKNRMYRVALETQATQPREWFELLNYLILSPKPPSSLMTYDRAALHECIINGPANTTLKIVVFNKDDFDFAYMVHRQFPAIPMYLSVGNDEADLNKEGFVANRDALLWQATRVSEWVIKSGWSQVILTPQLHTLLWGGERGR